MIVILTLIENMPDLVGRTLAEFETKRKEKKLATPERKRKIIERLMTDPKKYIGYSLEDMIHLGIDVDQNGFLRKIRPAVQKLTDSKRKCLECKLYDIPGRTLRSDQIETEEPANLDITFSSASLELDMIASEIGTRSQDLPSKLDQAMEKIASQKIEIDCLKRENQQLRAELKIFDPIRNLFSRQKAIFRNAVYPISSYMNRFIMLLLCQGLSGTSIHKFLSLLFNEYTDCFTRDEPNMIFKMPSLPHICNLRKAIGPLCNQQILQFIENGTRFALSSDGTTTNKCSRNLLGIGLLNQDLEFISLQNKLTNGKKSEDLAVEMIAAIPSSITNKIDFFISDSDHTQLKMQRILNELLNEISGQQKQRSSLICIMHCGANLSTRCFAELPEHIKQMFKDLELLFGSSQNSGFRRECQKNRLLDILKHEKVYVAGLRFKCTKGSRFGIHPNNAVCSIQYHSAIVKCLNEAQANQNKWQQKRLERASNDHTIDWPVNRLFMSAFTMLWIGISRRVLKIENGDLSITEKKIIVSETIQRYQRIINCENKFEELARICIMATKSGCETLAIANAEKWFTEANETDQKKIEEYLLAASTSAIVKIEKDAKSLLEMEDSEDKIPSTNRFKENVI